MTENRIAADELVLVALGLALGGVGLVLFALSSVALCTIHSFGIFAWI